MILLNSNSIIYILAPGGKVSGGPEALHQLRYYLELSGFNAYLCYYSSTETPERYLIYNPKVLPIEEISDHFNNIVICPEANTKLLKGYNNCKKCIWWLGLQCYDGFETMPFGFKSKMRFFLREHVPNVFLKFRNYFLKYFFVTKYNQKPYLVSKKDFHLCGSKFAFDFVSKRFKNVFMFVEPISLFFLKNSSSRLDGNMRSNVVLYNPAKPSSVINQLLERGKIALKPIEGLDLLEMSKLFSSTKLYVDFGYFGGPERLPKETVFFGCVILVGKRNASINDFDVAIPNKYKIDDFSNIEEIEAKIFEMLDDYKTIIDDFSFFREKISLLEEKFLIDIKKIFIKSTTQ